MGRKDSLASGDLTDTHYYILLALMKPKHGYAIMQTIAELTEDKVNLGPGSVYTMTQKLLHAGYIELWKEAEQRKVYIITETGMNVFQQEVRRREQMVHHGKEALQQKGVPLPWPNENI